jgi:hypothetical protein
MISTKISKKLVLVGPLAPALVNVIKSHIPEALGESLGVPPETSRMSDGDALGADDGRCWCGNKMGDNMLILSKLSRDHERNVALSVDASFIGARVPNVFRGFRMYDRALHLFSGLEQ